MLPNIDLNLLKLFASLYKNGSVSLTALELNLSQSACSHALNRLRQRLGDELFVRIENQMVPTVFAKQIAQNVIPALQLLSQGLAPMNIFNHNEATTFTIATTDYTAWCLKPLADYFNEYHPLINLRFVSLEQRIPQEALQDGRLDFACGFSHQSHLERLESVDELFWFSDKYVTAISQQHPLASQASLSLHDFLHYQHVLIAPWNETKGIVDVALGRLKKTRKIAITVPHVLISPYYLNNSQRLLTLPQAYARQIEEPLNLMIFQPPISVPNYEVKMYFHKTRKNDAKIQWFLEKFKAIFNL